MEGQAMSYYAKMRLYEALALTGVLVFVLVLVIVGWKWGGAALALTLGAAMLIALFIALVTFAVIVWREFYEEWKNK